MLTFIVGLFVGSIGTIFIISLMFAAKRGDQHIERYQMQHKSEQDKKTK